MSEARAADDPDHAHERWADDGGRPHDHAGPVLVVAVEEVPGDGAD